VPARNWKRFEARRLAQQFAMAVQKDIALLRAGRAIDLLAIEVGVILVAEVARYRADGDLLRQVRADRVEQPLFLDRTAPPPARYRCPGTSARIRCAARDL
jgi:hypothetical protein